jgi:hypothetical protein
MENSFNCPPTLLLQSPDRDRGIKLAMRTLLRNMGGGSGNTAPRILELGSRWRWVVSFTPRRIPGTQWIGRWLYSRAGLRRFGEEKNLFSLPGIELRFLGHRTSSVVPIPTTLSRISTNWAELRQTSIRTADHHTTTFVETTAISLVECRKYHRHNFY